MNQLADIPQELCESNVDIRKEVPKFLPPIKQQPARPIIECLCSKQVLFFSEADSPMFTDISSELKNSYDLDSWIANSGVPAVKILKDDRDN